MRKTAASVKLAGIGCRSGVPTAITSGTLFPGVVGATDGRELLETGTSLRRHSRPSVAPTFFGGYANAAIAVRTLLLHLYQGKKRACRIREVVIAPTDLGHPMKFERISKCLLKCC